MSVTKPGRSVQSVMPTEVSVAVNPMWLVVTVTGAPQEHTALDQMDVSVGTHIRVSNTFLISEPLNRISRTTQHYGTQIEA